MFANDAFGEPEPERTDRRARRLAPVSVAKGMGGRQSRSVRAEEEESRHLMLTQANAATSCGEHASSREFLLPRESDELCAWLRRGRLVVGWFIRRGEPVRARRRCRLLLVCCRSWLRVSRRRVRVM